MEEGNGSDRPCFDRATGMRTGSLTKVAPPHGTVTAHQSEGRFGEIPLSLRDLRETIPLPLKCPRRTGAAASTAMLAGHRGMKRCPLGRGKARKNLSDENERAVFRVDKKPIIPIHTKPGSNGGVSLVDRGMIGKGRKIPSGASASRCEMRRSNNPAIYK